MEAMKRSLWMALACLIPLGCAGAAAGAGSTPRPGAQPAKVQGATVPAARRAASAMAYEHYLKARMQLDRNHLREAVAEMRQALVYDGASPHLHVSLGRLYARQGLWRLAAEQASEALGLDAKDTDALILKADSLVQAGKKDEALELYRRVVSLAPKHIGAYIRMTAIYLERKDQDKAVEVLKQMTAKNPDSAEGFRQLGNLYFEQGDEKQAETYYRRALQLDGSDTRTIQTLTGLLEQQGRYKEAVQVFVDALESSPENPYYMAIMARLYLKLGDHQAAQAYLDQLRAADPKNASLIARAYAEINQHQEAIAELEKVLAADPKAYNEHLLVAILYEERKQWDQALAHLAKIPPDSRYYVGAQTSIGYSLMNLGRLDEAAQVLSRALELTQDPDELGQLFRNLATVYGRQKRFDKGLKMLDKAIESKPELSYLVEAKADLLFEAGRAEEGVAVLKRALEKKPSDISLLYALGALYERMGKVPESLAAMRKLLTLDPNNASALNFIGYTMADQGQDLDEAERLIRRALLLNPGNGAITDSLGWVLYKQGQYEKALDYLQRADRVTPGEPVIIMHVGDAYLKLGQRPKAIEAYHRALDAGPEPRDKAQILERLEKLGIKP